MMMAGWLTADGNSASIIDIIQRAKLYVAAGGTIYVGTDSLLTNQRCVLVSTICFYGARETNGGFYYYKKEVLNARHFTTLRARIMHEVQNTINLALYLHENNVDRLRCT